MTKWEDYWDTDWEILTNKIKPIQKTFQKIERGKVTFGNNQFARFRGDRWYAETYDQPMIWDLHMENDNPSDPEKAENMFRAMKSMSIDIPKWMRDHAVEHFKNHGR